MFEMLSLVDGLYRKVPIAAKVNFSEARQTEVYRTLSRSSVIRNTSFSRIAAL